MSELLDRLGAGGSSPSRAALFTAVPYAVVVLALFAALGLSAGWATAALSGVTLVAGATVPGAALVRILLPNRGPVHMFVLGTTFGIMLWTLGGFLSYLTGIFVARWVPSTVAIALLIIIRALGRLPRRQRSLPMPPAVSAGALVGVLAIVPALRTALETQPSSWDGWYSLYVDLPFQAAIAAEVAARVPEQAPWVAGTPLSYTWAFHSAMGVWSSTSTVSPSTLVFQAWPVVFSVLIPALIAIVAWELSRNTWVATLSPLMFALVHGVLMSPTVFVQKPLFALSPTRDFGHLTMLVVILALYKTLGRRSVRALSIPWLVALGFGMLVATASKGSVMPVLLGGVLAACFVLVVTRRFTWPGFLPAVVFGAGAIVGFRIAIPDTQSASSLSWGPLTFLGSAPENTTLLSLVIIGLLLFSIIGFWLLLGHAVDWMLASLIAGTMLAGLFGVALLTQSGGSQNYFWQAVEPLIAIATAWCGVVLTKTYGVRVVFVVVGIAVVGNLALRLAVNPAVLSAAIVVMAAAGAVIIVLRSGGRSARGAAISPIVIALVLTQAAQLVGVPDGRSGGYASSAEDQVAVHSSQLDAFEFIRTHTGIDDVLVTNSHCIAGSVDGGDCVARRFILAAMSERRVLVEGWSYTQFGEEAGWAHDRVALGDDFIDVPSSAGARSLLAMGVGFIYVDMRLPVSPELEDYSTLVFDSEWARVYQLQD